MDGEVVWRCDLAEQGESHGGWGEKRRDTAEVAFPSGEVFHGDDSCFGRDIAGEAKDAVGDTGCTFSVSFEEGRRERQRFGDVVKSVRAAVVRESGG